MAAPVAIINPVTIGKSADEEDMLERSTKKAKDNTLGATSVPSDVLLSYKEIVTGCSAEEMEDGSSDEEGEERALNAMTDGIRIVEESIGGYECPVFILSEAEEKRIQRPWKRGVIVKLLGRRIGYKALENRLNQMWVRKGVINIIDLSNNYYLVAFSNEEDKREALTNGPWFIYDHYLTIKDWIPNFQPECDTIDEVAVWVRISGLPIEYYDARVLTVIGNRIRRAIKVDKNTIKQERGKYARVCVAVNLTKPLLAMLNISGRNYKVEYECFHLLFLCCGRYGHYKEGCPHNLTHKGKVHTDQTGKGVKDGEGISGVVKIGDNVVEGDGPWKIVQKQK
ncbi:uncharacterized protein LOC131642759 [Vicia villosa]|uniref:uncharacterized protein LOC131642759 n=1 Tax=Vicia villosa TaxID=3911 RepID=UPI00273C1F21|nr:uncharacterized protein LOC131642759 [Vicia villosa]